MARKRTDKTDSKKKKKTSGLKDQFRRDSFRKRMKAGKRRRQNKSFFRSDVDIPFWKCDEGPHVIDIVPYLAGPNDPDTEEGEGTYVLEVYVHRDVGNIEGQMVICPSETFGDRCPICEHRKKLTREGDADEDLLNELRPSRYPRSIYNIVCYDSRREEEKGVQVWHTSNYLFEQHLQKLAEGPRRRGSSEPDSYVYFAHPTEGKSISFTTEGKKMNLKHMGLQFVERDYDIDDELLEQAFTLDDLIEVPTYEEIYKMYWGEEGGADEEEDEYDDEEEDEEEEERPARRRKSKSKSKPKRRRPEPEDEEEDEDEEEEEDDTEEGECPAGGVFGEDCNQFDECEDCAAWDACYAEMNDGEEDDEDEEEDEERPRRKSKTKKSKGKKREPAKPKKKSKGRLRRR